MTAAIQSERKRGSPSGAQAELLSGADAVVGIGRLADSAMLTESRSFQSCGRSSPKRPLATTPSPNDIDDEPGDEDHGRIANFLQKVLARDEDEEKSGNGDQGRNRIQPHAKWTWQ